MSYAIVYSSPTGNTAMLAQTIREALPQAECCYFGEPDDQALSAKRIYVGFWTDKGSCDGETAAFLPLLHGKEAALFGTAGFGGDRDYFAGILQRAQSLLPQDCRCHPGFLCQGKMPPAVGERYRAALEQNPQDPRALGMWAAFQEGLHHPNRADEEALLAWAREILPSDGR